MEMTVTSDGTRFFSSCACALRDMAEEKKPNLDVRVTQGWDRAWPLVPLRVTSTRLGTEDLAELPRILYGDNLATPEDVVAAWGDIMAMVISKEPVSRIAKVCSEVFPCVPFTPIDPAGLRSVLARFLWACRWVPGVQTRFKGIHALVQYRGAEMGIDGRVLLTAEGKRIRLQLKEYPLLNGALTLSNTPVTKWNMCSYKLAAVYRHLVRLRPDHQAMLDIVFSGVVSFGSEDLILPQFTLVDREQPRSRDELFDLLKLIASGAYTNPKAALYDLLQPIIGHREFFEAFGPGHPDDGTFYRGNIRLRYLDLIRRLSNGESITKPEEAQGSEAALRLIQLQRLIGRA